MMQTLRDLVEYRELFFAFVLRDLKVRYKQTALGVMWVVLQPLITSVVFAGIIGLIRGRFDGVEGLLFFMAGLVAWTSFQGGVTQASQSLETNANLVSKIYFPRLTVPSAYVIGSLVDFLFAFGSLLIISAIFGYFSIWLLVIMPAMVLIQVCFAMGLGFILSTLNAQYRDIKFTVPFILQLAMFITVWVPLSDFRDGNIGFVGENSELWNTVIYNVLTLNPMAGVIDSYRAVIEGRALDSLLLLKGSLISLVTLAVGVRFFMSRERRLADIL